MKNEIVKSNSAVVKTDNEILASGAQSLDDWFDTFQYLTFVLDESGSMESGLQSGWMPAGERDKGKSKWELQRAVVKKYIETKLSKKTDMKIGIVVYSDVARVALQGSSDLKEASTVISGLVANSGGTDLSKGMKTAMALVKGSHEMVPRLIITGDGETGSREACYSLAIQAQKKGIIVDTIFIGPAGFVLPSA